jgi:hypothetical protein
LFFGHDRILQCTPHAPREDLSLGRYVIGRDPHAEREEYIKYQIVGCIVITGFAALANGKYCKSKKKS